MELLEWLDLKYEGYLSEINLLKHEKVKIGVANLDTEELKALRLIGSDHQMMMDSLGDKIEQLNQIEEMLEKIEDRTGTRRMEVEQDVEEIQIDLQRLKINKIVSEIKYT